MARLTRPNFEAWLSQQKPMRRFGKFTTYRYGLPHCPIAHWAGGQADSLGYRWAIAFAKAVDKSPGKTITAARALKLLRSIP